VGQKRIGRLMREEGIKGESRRRWSIMTRRALGARPAPDLVERWVVADRLDQLWVADITYVPTQL
jgi:transposase InsO family protein